MYFFFSSKTRGELWRPLTRETAFLWHLIFLNGYMTLFSCWSTQ